MVLSLDLSLSVHMCTVLSAAGRLSLSTSAHELYTPVHTCTCINV